MYRIPSTLNGDLDYTQSLIDQFKAGEIQAGQLKSNRVPMGIYEQRKNQHYMLRLRCAGGLVTPEQLAKIAFVGHQLSTSHLHVTTRQEIQIHNVDIEDAIPALKKLEKVGISSAGGGGNTVRNMMVDDRSGLTADEEFDVYPYVEELTSRLIAEKDSFTMPTWVCRHVLRTDNEDSECSSPVVPPATPTPVGKYSTSFQRRISTVQPRL